MLQTIVDGLVLGGLYGLAAVGFSLVFGVMGVVNLTHGIFVVCGAYIAYSFWNSTGWDPLLSIPLVMVILFAFGYLYYRGIIAPAIRRSSLLASMLITFGVALMLRNVLLLVFSPELRTITPSYAFVLLKGAGVTIDVVRVSSFLASLVLLAALAAVLRWTRVGRVIRATAQQELASRLCGVNTRHIYAMTFGVSAAFAGAAGVTIGIVLPFSPTEEAIWTMNAFIVVTLGGVGSPAGALIGGLVLGLINTFTATWVGSAYTNATMFLILLLMLLLRPAGLLGNAFHESR